MNNKWLLSQYIYISVHILYKAGRMLNIFYISHLILANNLWEKMDHLTESLESFKNVAKLADRAEICI